MKRLLESLGFDEEERRAWRMVWCWLAHREFRKTLIEHSSLRFFPFDFADEVWCEKCDRASGQRSRTIHSMLALRGST